MKKINYIEFDGKMLGNSRDNKKVEVSKKMKNIKKIGLLVLSTTALGLIAGVSVLEVNTNKQIQAVENTTLNVEVNEKQDIQKLLELEATNFTDISVTDENIDFNKIGTYKATIKYGSLVTKIFNKNELKSATVIVNVKDTKAPSVTVKNKDLTIKVFDKKGLDKVRENIEITDNYTELKDLKKNIVIENLDVNKVGKQEITIKVKDSSNNESVLKSNIIVEDKEAPKINGISDVTLAFGEKWSAKDGLKVTDNVDKLTVKDIKVSLNGKNYDSKNHVSTKKAGTYTLKYEVTDKSKNKTVKTRKVIVKEEVIVEPIVVNEEVSAVSNPTVSYKNNTTVTNQQVAKTTAKAPVTSQNYALDITTQYYAGTGNPIGAGFYRNDNLVMAHNPGDGARFLNLSIGSLVRIDGTVFRITQFYRANGAYAEGYHALKSDGSQDYLDNNGNYIWDSLWNGDLTLKTCVNDDKQNYIFRGVYVSGNAPAEIQQTIEVSSPE